MELLFPLLLVALLVPMFLGVRRQKREAEKVSSMQDNLKIGNQVITTSGLYGTVVELDDTTVDLEIAEDVVTTWLRQAIREVRAEDAVSTEETGTDATSSDSSDATDAIEESAEQTETRLTKD
ncbi:preprotein translocase subunit YajC [Nocardia sp. NBC_00508]|uniref:preprotein translocase subunit YajC n=1 Tax=Nocardia sp. NBC_00508 TaxID=2975992 RepID=UPI002E822817|nr:preprotein translocase subunit YajC [Nocardia sp. NBC_00508]WUD65330.1 preprotein translocase subunit YajC [Nocardia sp. NBC_00508]